MPKTALLGFDESQAYRVHNQQWQFPEEHHPGSVRKALYIIILALS